MLYEFSSWQIFVALAFLGILLLLQYYIKKNKGSIRKTFQLNKRINLLENAKIGNTDSIQLIKIDRTEYAIFSTRGATPFVLQIENNKLAKHTGPLETSESKIAKTNTNKTDSATSNSQKDDNKMLRAISIARRLNPKVNF